jgi:hypothetical protein
MDAKELKEENIKTLREEIERLELIARSGGYQMAGRINTLRTRLELLLSDKKD